MARHAELTDQRYSFCLEYLIDFNGSRAAIAAGYAKAGAGAAASRLLKDRKVQEVLQELTAKRHKRLELTADKVLEEFAKIAFHNVQDLLDFFDGKVRFKNLHEIDFPEIIKSIEVKKVKEKGGTYGEIIKITTHDKLKALEALGRHMALFTENVNLTNNGKDLPEPKVNVEININHRGRNEPLLN